MLTLFYYLIIFRMFILITLIPLCLCDCFHDSSQIIPYAFFLHVRHSYPTLLLASGFLQDCFSYGRFPRTLFPQFLHSCSFIFIFFFNCLSNVCQKKVMVIYLSCMKLPFSPKCPLPALPRNMESRHFHPTFIGIQMFTPLYTFFTNFVHGI